MAAPAGRPDAAAEPCTWMRGTAPEPAAARPRAGEPPGERFAAALDASGVVVEASSRFESRTGLRVGDVAYRRLDERLGRAVPRAILAVTWETLGASGTGAFHVPPVSADHDWVVVRLQREVSGGTVTGYRLTAATLAEHQVGQVRGLYAALHDAESVQDRSSAALVAGLWRLADFLDDAGLTYEQLAVQPFADAPPDDRSTA